MKTPPARSSSVFEMRMSPIAVRPMVVTAQCLMIRDALMVVWENSVFCLTYPNILKT